MTDFHNVRFPEDVSWGSLGGPMFKTHVFSSHRGYEKRNCEWVQPLMKFNAAYGVKTDDQMLNVISFFNARRGRAHPFRYKHWGNFAIINGPIATGDGISTRLPLYKFYGFEGGRRFYKRLRKIVRGSVVGVQVLATPVVEGVDFSIDYEAGEIALNSPPGYGIPIYAASLEFDEPVRFDIDNIQIVIDAYNSNSLTELPLMGIRGTFSAGSIFAPAADPDFSDEFFHDTPLILNFDDTTNLTTTTDQSELANPITFNGTATLTTAAFQHGSGSFSPGTDGHIEVSGTAFAVSNLPFTIEAFIQQPTVGTPSQTIISKWDETGNNRCYQLRFKLATQRLEFVISTDGTDEITVISYPWSTAAAGYFDYLSIDKMVNGWYVLRINGETVQTARNVNTINDAATPLTIGRKTVVPLDDGSYRSLIDSVRFTIGRARHSGFLNIEVPSPYIT